MEYIILTGTLFMIMLVYFKIAAKYNIIDKPNHRSAHSEITIRGGGIVFPVAFMFFIFYVFCFKQYQLSLNYLNQPNFLIFGAGLLTICIISFLDDILDLSSKVRLVFHFLAVTLLLCFVNAFQLLDWWVLPVFYILIIGILNAYNFMDGINGMSGLYSLVVLGSLWFVNQYIIDFSQIDFIIFPIIATIVFLFFNFRTKAKCFLGDVGSMGMAFWIIALIALLILKTNQIKWILFLAIYGTETILTIIERLKLKENIFKAHRRHLYQLLANELKIPQLYVSSLYACLQFLINLFIINTSLSDSMIFLVVLLPTVVCYIIVKYKIKKQIIVS